MIASPSSSCRNPRPFRFTCPSFVPVSRSAKGGAWPLIDTPLVTEAPRMPNEPGVDGGCIAKGVGRSGRESGFGGGLRRDAERMLRFEAGGGVIWPGLAEEAS